MEIRIFDRTLRFAGVCDSVLRAWAEECYDTAGRFSICTPAAAGKLFAVDDVLMIPGTEDGFVVESIREDGEETVIGGRGVLSYFARRIVDREITFSGNAESLLLDLAEEFAPAVLPGSLSVMDFGRETTVNAEAGYAPLLSVMEQIGLQTGLGLRLRFEPESGFVFSVREKNAGGRFLSRSAGSLLSAVRRCDLSSYVNRVIVRGNGGHRVTVDAGDEGAMLREMHENAEDLALSRFTSTGAYTAALLARGERRLAARRPARSVQVYADEVSASEIAVGDVCPVSDSRLQIRAEAFCRARKVEFDGDSVRCSVTLSVTAESE